MAQGNGRRMSLLSGLRGLQQTRETISKCIPVEILETRLLLSSVIKEKRLLRPHTKAGAIALHVPKTWTATPAIESGPITPAGSSVPYGTTPTAMRGAYGLGAYGASTLTFGGVQADGSGQTICIVDAYDDPNALSDLNAFSTYYGLPTFNTGGPTFTKYGVTDGIGSGYGLTTTLPGTDPAGPSSTNSTWEQEESLDIEWSHVMAPKANIVLVESSAPDVGLYYGDYYGGALSGVVAVSNSWAGGEFDGEDGNDFVFTTPTGHIGGANRSGGVTYLFSTGDSGAYAGGTQTISTNYPASSPNVLAVGGTSLTTSGNAYVSESAWGNGVNSGYYGGGGGGISQYESQPTWQNGVVNAYSTTQRTYPDISLEADPGAPGVPIYDSWDFGTSTPWLNGYEGGTSLSCPMMAGILAVVNQGVTSIGQGSLDGVSQTIPQIYALNSNNFHDITTGSNGYSAGPGYDLATGIGSPIGNPFIVNLSGALNTINGTSGNDTIRLVRSSSNLQVYLNNATTPFYNVPFATLPAITVLGTTGADSINIDFSGGATPVPSAGLTVNGATGTDTLILTGTTSNDTAVLNTSTVTFNNSAINYATVASIVVNGNGGADTLTQTAQPGNSASVVFNGSTSGGPSSADTLNVNNSTFTFAAPAAGAGIAPISLASLSIGSGGTVAVLTAASHTDRWYLLLGALTLSGAANAWTSRLNLGGNDMVVKGGNLTTLTSQLSSGFSNGAWSGQGIASTAAGADSTHKTAIGVILNSAALYSSSHPFDGYSAATTDVLFKYTYFGDTNLDGKVDGSDYSKIDFASVTPSLTGWQNGDFNYDSHINGSDYTLIDNAFNTQGAPL